MVEEGDENDSGAANQQRQQQGQVAASIFDMHLPVAVLQLLAQLVARSAKALGHLTSRPARWASARGACGPPGHPLPGWPQLPCPAFDTCRPPPAARRPPPAACP